MRSCFDGCLEGRVVHLELCALIHLSAHPATVRLLVVVHPMLRIGDHSLALDPLHRGTNQRRAEERVLSGDVLEVPSVEWNACKAHPGAELYVLCIERQSVSKGNR